MRNLSYENGFHLHVHFHANQSHFQFHENGFAFRLVVKHRHKGTRKWPILIELDIMIVFSRQNDAKKATFLLRALSLAFPMTVSFIVKIFSARSAVVGGREKPPNI